MSGSVVPNQKLYEAVRYVLLTEWDPIGVSPYPEASNEYDAYVPEVYQLLVRRSDAQEVFDFLWAIETEHMGLCGERERTHRVAKHLVDSLGAENFDQTGEGI
ncbi:hypothetical protein [Haliangium ochraceum]|uniref:DUF1871 domain-containing protein n=1 Tax=Haliangium ochraceum (strain DSM 14365 / JCM 11303 / SMP-2) TaxID=502025 RepID=D0LN39_HALO1|nr:hypothetical protein [Haliangium ochraceum]ACY13410.1 hypothetical protein Hoch_0794 [Haliangium ochraceum DSM 14365]